MLLMFISRGIRLSRWRRGEQPLCIHTGNRALLDSLSKEMARFDVTPGSGNKILVSFSSNLVDLHDFSSYPGSFVSAQMVQEIMAMFWRKGASLRELNEDNVTNWSSNVPKSTLNFSSLDEGCSIRNGVCG